MDKGEMVLLPLWALQCIVVPEIKSLNKLGSVCTQWSSKAQHIGHSLCTNNFWKKKPCGVKILTMHQY